MSARFTVPATFKSLEDATEHGHEAAVALAAELDGATVAGPDDKGVLDVTLEADSFEEARNRVWECAVNARVTDYLESVG
jgi:hypothetical protein